MNEFRWRNRARCIARAQIGIAVIHVVYTTFLLLEKLETCSSFYDKNNPFMEELTEIKKVFYQIMKVNSNSPKTYTHLLRCLLFLYLEIRGTCDLLRGTRLVTDTRGIIKAVERCQTWQKIHVSTFFFSVFLGVPQSPRKWLSRILNIAKMVEDLKHFLFRVLIEYWFYNQVGQYISELQKELRRRR